MSRDGAIILLVICLPLVVASLCFHTWRSDALLDRFVKERGYRLIRKERRTLFRGPFFFSTGRGQEVYYITVEDREGQLLCGYVRCGGAIFGMFSDNLEVIWDKPKPRYPSRPEPRGFPVIPLNEQPQEDLNQPS